MTPLLEVVGVQAGYGTLPVLFGVDLLIKPGEAVTLRVGNGSAGPSIDVIDHGPGIDDERLKILFDRFQRSDSGSGLGLAIARRVVERHGGTIRVQTKPGSGSTFTIELPPG